MMINEHTHQLSILYNDIWGYNNGMEKRMGSQLAAESPLLLKKSIKTGRQVPEVLSGSEKPQGTSFERVTTETYKALIGQTVRSNKLVQAWTSQELLQMKRQAEAISNPPQSRKLAEQLVLYGAVGGGALAAILTLLQRFG